ncbi:MAG: trimeric autotransporter adhesin [Thermoleophilaceae bacterium]|jgi:hypothetical protein|nr:trimeric autotransporter adhesin [Thermoleophilaceae bacterium]
MYVFRRPEYAAAMKLGATIWTHVRGNAVAYLALFIALGSTGAYAANVDLKRNQVKTKHIKGKAVTTAKLKGKAVTTAKLANGAVTSRTIAGGAVGAGKLAAGAVGSTELADGGVTSPKLAAGAVGAGKLAPGSVGSSELQDGQVTAADLARPPRLIEYSGAAGTSDVPILSVGDLLLRADCAIVGGGASIQLLIEAAASSGTGTVESSGIAESEAGVEATFVNGPIAMSTSFDGVFSVSDGDAGAGGADGNFKILYDGPGVAVSVDLTLTATNTASSDTCTASGIAVSAG